MRELFGLADKVQVSGPEEDGLFSSFFRIERNLRHALKPVYEDLFERLNTHPGGLRFLSILRADILSILAYGYDLCYTINFEHFCCVPVPFNSCIMNVSRSK